MSASLPNPFMYSVLTALQRPGTSDSDDHYLFSILGRENVDTSIFSPAYRVQQILSPALATWGHRYLLNVTPSGSFAKGTANRSGTDLDLFISVSPDTPNTLAEIYDRLSNQVRARGYSPTRQNVSIGINAGGLKVDLVPGRAQSWYSSDHSLYHRKTGTWRKTNVAEHVRLVQSSGRQAEIRLIKLWRDQHRLEFPSFYLELAVIEALKFRWAISISSCILGVLDYLSSDFQNARFIDPANSNNVISDELSAAEKGRIRQAAAASIAQTWNRIVR